MIISLPVLCLGVFAGLHSLLSWDAGLHGVKLGIGLGGIFYGFIALYLGAYLSGLFRYKNKKRGATR